VLKIAWRGLRFNLGRYIATIIAIVTGIGFFAATGFLSQRVINALEGDAVRQFGGVDVAVVADTKADPSNSDFASKLRIPGDVADQIAATPGVDASGGVLTGSVAFLGDDGKPFATSATGRLWITDDELEPLDVKQGRAPSAAGEIAVDRGTAKDHDLDLGETVTVLTLDGQQPATIVGITSFGDTDALDQGGTVSIPDATAFDWLNSGTREYEDLYLRGSGSQSELRDAVQPAVPNGFKAQIGQEFLDDQRSQAGAFGHVLQIGLQVFALIALFVGAFVIYNTFSVIVVQRMRELAVFAAIGATPRQIRRSLAVEGLLIGILGSVLGVIVGIGLAFLLDAVLKAAGVSLPGSGIVVEAPAVIRAVALGTIITYLSVRIPARRASRAEPIEAMRQAAVETKPYSRKRLILALALIVLGAVGVLVGPWVAVGVGALALFIGVIVAGPMIALIGAWLSRPVLDRFGLEGRLAADNTVRSPKRTATTANALLIGVFLVSLVTIAGTSIKDFAVAEINKLSSADYVIESTGGTVDPQLVQSVEQVPGVQQVVPFQRESVTIDGKPAAISSGDIAALQSISKLDVAQGSFEDLGPGKIAVLKAANADVGATVTVADAQGKATPLTVAVVLDMTIDALQMGSIVDQATFTEVVGERAPTVAFIDAKPGEQSDTKDRIQDLADLRPDITLTVGNSLGKLVGTVFDFLINAVNGLLLMSVAVALIGIINTLSLSILERRRELGLLRVIGMVDKRVRRMVRLESILISALGTVMGIVLGAFVGIGLILAIDRLSDAGISVSMPWLLLGVVLVLGIALGLIASIIPARRSTRLDVLDAIQAT